MYALNHALERFFGDSVRVLTYSSYTVRHASYISPVRTSNQLLTNEKNQNALAAKCHHLPYQIYLEFLLRSTGALFTASLQVTTRVAPIAYYIMKFIFGLLAMAAAAAADDGNNAAQNYDVYDSYAGDDVYD